MSNTYPQRRRGPYEGKGVNKPPLPHREGEGGGVNFHC